MHRAVLQIIIPALWLAWLLYWIVAAADVKPTRWRETVASRLLHRVPLVLAAMLLASHPLEPLMTERYLPEGALFPFLGAIMVAVGLGFAICARRHLGGNWSGAVTLKEDHSLIYGAVARLRGLSARDRRVAWDPFGRPRFAGLRAQDPRRGGGDAQNLC
jgi:hypothetical protein